VGVVVRNLTGLSPRWRFFAEPFEVLLALAALLAGVPVVWGATRPVSLAAQLSPWLLRAWGVSLIVGGLLTLWARWRIARARTDPGLIAASRLEAVAMLLFATSLGVYGLAILAVGVAGLASGPITLAYAAAFGVRARIITRQLAEARRMLLDRPDD
jgi:NhaP-type Na+/H+ and K+/H+ antiporter